MEAYYFAKVDARVRFSLPAPKIVVDISYVLVYTKDIRPIDEVVSYRIVYPRSRVRFSHGSPNINYGEYNENHYL